MKVTTTDTPSVKVLDYPKLMKHDYGNSIVLMSSNEIGTVLSSDSYQQGYRASTWDMSLFKDYTGTVTLEN